MFSLIQVIKGRQIAFFSDEGGIRTLPSPPHDFCLEMKSILFRELFHTKHFRASWHAFARERPTRGQSFVDVLDSSDVVGRGKLSIPPHQSWRETRNHVRGSNTDHSAGACCWHQPPLSVRQRWKTARTGEGDKASPCIFTSIRSCARVCLAANTPSAYSAIIRKCLGSVLTCPP